MQWNPRKSMSYACPRTSIGNANRKNPAFPAIGAKKCPRTQKSVSHIRTKNEGKRVEDSALFVKEVSVGGGRQLKRLRPAPQGRGYRIRKRSNHVTLIVDSKNDSN